MNRQEQIEAAVDKYTDNPANYLEYCDDGWEDKTDIDYVERAFMAGIEWSDAHQSHWHEAQGDDLPPIDKEVIVLRNNGQIAFGHRPNPDGEVWKHPDGTLEHVYFETYDKGGWNISNVKWWCDIMLPEQQ